MAIFKRGRVYWYHFIFNGEHIQESTKQRNPRVARQIEAAHRTRLAKGEVGIQERKKAPTLAKFAKEFQNFIEVRREAKPKTVVFYKGKLARLLDFDFLASQRLDEIDEALIERFVFERRKQVSPGTVNREVATLRRILRLAQEWKVIDRVPRIRLLDGERTRDFVLTQQLEHEYLNRASQPLKDIASLILETGLRIGEALQLRWEHVRLDPLPGARFGYIRVVEGKSKNARRNIPLTDRAASMLRSRADCSNICCCLRQCSGRDLPRYLDQSSPSKSSNRDGTAEGLCYSFPPTYNVNEVRRVWSGCFHDYEDCGP
jgi:integrase